jgi:hypothetical protein
MWVKFQRDREEYAEMNTRRKLFITAQYDKSVRFVVHDRQCDKEASALLTENLIVDKQRGWRSK